MRLGWNLINLLRFECHTDDFDIGSRVFFTRNEPEVFIVIATAVPQALKVVIECDHGYDYRINESRCTNREIGN